MFYGLKNELVDTALFLNQSLSYFDDDSRLSGGKLCELGNQVFVVGLLQVEP